MTEKYDVKCWDCYYSYLKVAATMEFLHRRKVLWFLLVGVSQGAWLNWRLWTGKIWCISPCDFTSISIKQWQNVFTSWRMWMFYSFCHSDDIISMKTNPSDIYMCVSLDLFSIVSMIQFWSSLDITCFTSLGISVLKWQHIVMLYCDSRTSCFQLFSL